MNEYEWHIEVRDRPARFVTDIYIFRRGSSGKTIVYRDLDVETEHDHATTEIPPTLSVPSMMLPLIYEGFTKKGIKAPEQSFIAGKLEATENHLDDLRHLLKLDERIITNEQAS
jgi:hypothetical protein